MKEDETLCEVMKSINSQEWNPKLVRYSAFAKELGIIDEIVVRNDRIVLPLSLRGKALDIAHRGHPGIVTMRRILREKLW